MVTGKNKAGLSQKLMNAPFRALGKSKREKAECNTFLTFKWQTFPTSMQATAQYMPAVTREGSRYFS